MDVCSIQDLPTNKRRSKSATDGNSIHDCYLRIMMPPLWPSQYCQVRQLETH